LPYKAMSRGTVNNEAVKRKFQDHKLYDSRTIWKFRILGNTTKILDAFRKTYYSTRNVIFYKRDGKNDHYI